MAIFQKGLKQQVFAIGFFDGKEAVNLLTGVKLNHVGRTGKSVLHQRPNKARNRRTSKSCRLSGAVL